MPAIDRLLQRLGFVKLSRYGLVLTPEDRILSLRPAILDDGLRGKVVGWQDDDLAAAELKPWESPVAPSVATLVARSSVPSLVAPPSRPTMPIAVAPVALTPVAAAPARPTPAPAPAAAPARPTPAPARPTPAPAPAAQSVATPAPPHLVEEDEWEWEIALARVRAAADQVEEAARSPIARAPSPVRLAAAPAPASPSAPRVNKTMPIAAVAPVREATERPRSDSSEPAREPASVPAAERRGLPAPAAVVQLVPPASAAPPAGSAPAPRRLAKGTSPVTQKRSQLPSVRPRRAQADEPTVAEFSLSEQTVTQLSYDPDHTTPHLPLSDRTKPGVALPSIRGRLAR